MTNSRITIEHTTKLGDIVSLTWDEDTGRVSLVVRYWKEIIKFDSMDEAIMRISESKKVYTATIATAPLSNISKEEAKRAVDSLLGSLCMWRARILGSKT